MLPEQELSITVKVTTIRDGMHGISIAACDRLLGEWPDSGAASLTLVDNLAVSICGERGNQRYLLTMPGTPVHGKQVSDTEVVIVTRM